MSAPPPTLQPPRPDPPWRPLLAWFVIVACVILTVYNSAHAPHLKELEDLSNRMKVEVMGRMAISVSSLRKGAGANAGLTAQNSNMTVTGSGNSYTVSFDQENPVKSAAKNNELEAMQKEARTPADNVFVAIVAGEIEGGAQALAMLDLAASDNPSPDLLKDIADLRIIYSIGPPSLDPAAQARLLANYDYFGHVALAFNMPQDSGQRKIVEQTNIRIIVTAFVVVLGLMALFLAGLGLGITAIVLFATGKIKRAYTPAPFANAAFLEAFAIYLVLYFFAIAFVLRYLGAKGFGWNLLAFLFIPVVMFWTARRGETVAQLRNGFGWHTGKGWFHEIGAGLVGYVAGVPLIAFGMFLSVILADFTHGKPEPNGVIRLLFGSRWQLVAMYFLACVMAPVVEETMFRGALFHHLRRRWGWLGAAPLVAFIFAILHPYGWIAVPALASIAIVFAALREWRGSIIAPMSAHALHNFLITTFVLMILY